MLTNRRKFSSTIKNSLHQGILELSKRSGRLPSRLVDEAIGDLLDKYNIEAGNNAAVVKPRQTITSDNTQEAPEADPDDQYNQEEGSKDNMEKLIEKLDTQF